MTSFIPYFVIIRICLFQTSLCNIITDLNKSIPCEGMDMYMLSDARRALAALAIMELGSESNSQVRTKYQL